MHMIDVVEGRVGQFQRLETVGVVRPVPDWSVFAWVDEC